MTATVSDPRAAGTPGPRPVGQASAAPAAKPKDVHYIALRNFAMSISVFNIFGYTLLGFEQAWIFPITAVLVAYTTELTLETIQAWAQRRTPRYRGRGMRGVYEFLLPAHITALAVNMLIYTNDNVGPVIFGVMVGVSGKYILQAPIAGRVRHYMNPSNFGISMTLLLFSRWVAVAQPYEFTENANTYFRIMIALIIATAGTVLNTALTKRTMLIVGWLGGFAIQAFIRHWIWHVSLFSALGVMTGVPFVLFSNYMISDPGTTPSKGRAQFIFGGSVATVYGVLMLLNVVYTLFFATAIVCAARGLGWWAVHFYRKRKASATTRTATATADAAGLPAAA
ncbi:enediyne biosynthesis protein [Catenulispora sp. NL8]|uniref:Enediyne biosynthesis protein n=1 Tax=Catenulispora pinistramenti TaxID=2705254 RepID=A0ABS5KXQ8_9ACTN|nr:enediyne biosynthesis protein [Catenulispora pinistramenti]MBS2550795.1 enediyne biosynthesis protein [Catenulispora pinistramenti]